MSTNAIRGVGQEYGASTASCAVLRLEKTSRSRDSHGEERFTKTPHDRRGAKSTRRVAYRFETVQSVSHWDGPLLTSPFAAQVIGQALNAHDNAATSAREAY